MDFENMNLAEILAKRKTTIMYSQSNLQPLNSQINPGYQQNIFINSSRQFIDVGKGITLLFRPIIQMGNDSLPSLAAKMALGISCISPDSFWTFQAMTIAGQSILAQSQSQLQRTRSTFMKFYSNFTATQKKEDLTGISSMAGQSFSSGSAPTSVGFPKLLPSHPVSINPAAGGATIGAQFEGQEVTFPAVSGGYAAGTLTTNYYPRAICSRHKIINPDFNFMPQFISGTSASTGQINGCPVGNIYMGQYTSNNGDATTIPLFPGSSQTALAAIGGGIGTSAQAASNAGTNAINYVNFPNLARSCTPSINLYMAQNEKFEEMRRRFLTQVVTVYPNGNAHAVQSSINETMSPVQSGQTANGFLEQQTQMVCSVQGGVQASYAQGGGLTPSPATTVGGSISRTISGLSGPWSLTPTSCLYYPTEQYTTLQVDMGQLSLECDNLGEICLDGAPIQIQLQANLPQNVLSAWLQPSLYAYSNLNGGTANANTGATSAQIKTFLDSMVLGSASYVITDTCLRLQYLDYGEQNFEIVKKYHMAPKSYLSLRGPQIDSIPISTSGTFSQRIAISNPYIIGFVIFFQTTNNNKPSYLPTSGPAPASLTVADSMVNYFGISGVPTDLRGTYLDSYYVNMQDIYLDDGSGKRYPQNQIPLSNPQFITYLNSRDAIYTMFKRHLNISFAEFCANRFIQVIPFNVDLVPELALSTSQVVIQATIDYTPRIESSYYYGESNHDPSNMFSMVTYAVTAQSLVDGTMIRLG